MLSDKLLLSIFLELFGGLSDIHTFHLIHVLGSYMYEKIVDPDSLTPSRKGPALSLV